MVGSGTIGVCCIEDICRLGPQCEILLKVESRMNWSCAMDTM